MIMLQYLSILCEADHIYIICRNSCLKVVSLKMSILNEKVDILKTMSSKSQSNRHPSLVEKKNLKSSGKRLLNRSRLLRF